MKRTAFPLLAVLLLTLSASLAGCATTPAGKYGQLQDTYIGVVTTLVQARTVGKIDDTTWNTQVLPAINDGDSILNTMEVMVEAGQDPFELQALLQLVIDKLLVYAIQYQGGDL